MRICSLICDRLDLHRCVGRVFRLLATPKFALGLAVLVPLFGSTGCQEEKEIEYPAEAIPDIPPGDRSNTGPNPAE